MPASACVGGSQAPTRWSSFDPRPRSPPPPQSTTLRAGPRALAYNPAENAVLVQTDVEGGSYELYAVPKDSAGREVAPVGCSPVLAELAVTAWG